MSFMQFELDRTDGAARRGRLKFPRGIVETPAFMPVGTYGTVKAILQRDIEAIGAEIILGNTFHLMLRPGTEVVKAHGDLHDFINWQKPILTDSGGFQVWSLGELRKITEQGVSFKSPVDGSPVYIDPETSMRVHVLFHDRCFDGIASAATFTRFFREKIDSGATFTYRGLTHAAGTSCLPFHWPRWSSSCPNRAMSSVRR